MRKKVLQFFLGISLGLLVYDVNGQTTLTDLINYTLQHSRNIKKAELQIKEADYIRKEAIGYGLPQVEASASYSKMLLPNFGISDSASIKLRGIVDMLINEGVSDDIRQNKIGRAHV